VLKKRSSGPTVGKPSPRSFQFFFMVSYNQDALREFTQTQGFADVYDLTAEEFEQLKTDDIALFKFCFRLLKQVLFGEISIPVHPEAMQKRAQQRREQIKSDPDNPNNDYNGPEMV